MSKTWFPIFKNTDFTGCFYVPLPIRLDISISALGDIRILLEIVPNMWTSFHTMCVLTLLFFTS